MAGGVGRVGHVVAAHGGELLCDRFAARHVIAVVLPVDDAAMRVVRQGEQRVERAGEAVHRQTLGRDQRRGADIVARAGARVARGEFDLACDAPPRGVLEVEVDAADVRLPARGEGNVGVVGRERPRRGGIFRVERAGHEVDAVRVHGRGEVNPDEGKFDIGETVRFGYFSQEGLKFREDQKVIDVITEIADYIDLGGGKHMTASQFLQFFLFTQEEQHNYVYKLSGGEKRKLYLCTVLMRNPNFLILDEPTNDLDIQTLQVLEEYLQDFPGCVIVVSHDRYFMDKVVDHLLVFKGEGDIQDFPGNYTQYRDWSRLQTKENEEESSKAKSASKTGDAKNSDNASGTAKRDVNFENKRKMSFKEKREYEQLSKEIEALENEQKLLEEELCSGKLSVDELTEKSKRLPQIKDELDEKEMRWLELSELL